MKKILMSIGSVAAVATPIVATISCGSGSTNHRNTGDEEEKQPEKKKEEAHKKQDEPEKENNDVINGKITLRSNVLINGHAIKRTADKMFYLQNANSHYGEKPNIEEILAKGFKFQGKGSMKLDESLGTYEQQMWKIGYARYIIKDKVDDGTSHLQAFLFAKANRNQNLKVRSKTIDLANKNNKNIKISDIDKIMNQFDLEILDKEHINKTKEQMLEIINQSQTLEKEAKDALKKIIDYYQTWKTARHVINFAYNLIKVDNLKRLAGWFNNETPTDISDLTQIGASWEKDAQKYKYRYQNLKNTVLAFSLDIDKLVSQIGDLFTQKSNLWAQEFNINARKCLNNEEDNQESLKYLFDYSGYNHSNQKFYGYSGHAYGNTKQEAIEFLKSKVKYNKQDIFKWQYYGASQDSLGICTIPFSTPFEAEKNIQKILEEHESRRGQIQYFLHKLEKNHRGLYSWNKKRESDKIQTNEVGKSFKKTLSQLELEAKSRPELQLEITQEGKKGIPETGSVWTISSEQEGVEMSMQPMVNIKNIDNKEKNKLIIETKRYDLKFYDTSLYKDKIAYLQRGIKRNSEYYIQNESTPENKIELKIIPYTKGDKPEINKGYWKEQGKTYYKFYSDKAHIEVISHENLVLADSESGEVIVCFDDDKIPKSWKKREITTSISGPYQRINEPVREKAILKIMYESEKQKIYQNIFIEITGPGDGSAIDWKKIIYKHKNGTMPRENTYVNKAKIKHNGQEIMAFEWKDDLEKNSYKLLKIINKWPEKINKKWTIHKGLFSSSFINQSKQLNYYNKNVIDQNKKTYASLFDGNIKFNSEEEIETWMNQSVIEFIKNPNDIVGEELWKSTPLQEKTYGFDGIECGNTKEKAKEFLKSKIRFNVDENAREAFVAFPKDEKLQARFEIYDSLEWAQNGVEEDIINTRQIGKATFRLKNNNFWWKRKKQGAVIAESPVIELISTDEYDKSKNVNWWKNPKYFTLGNPVLNNQIETPSAGVQHIKFSQEGIKINIASESQSTQIIDEENKTIEVQMPGDLVSANALAFDLIRGKTNKSQEYIFEWKINSLKSIKIKALTNDKEDPKILIQKIAGNKWKIWSTNSHLEKISDNINGTSQNKTDKLGNQYIEVAFDDRPELDAFSEKHVVGGYGLLNDNNINKYDFKGKKIGEPKLQTIKREKLIVYGNNKKQFEVIGPPDGSAIDMSLIEMDLKGYVKAIEWKQKVKVNFKIKDKVNFSFWYYTLDEGEITIEDVIANTNHFIESRIIQKSVQIEDGYEIKKYYLKVETLNKYAGRITKKELPKIEDKLATGQNVAILELEGMEQAIEFKTHEDVDKWLNEKVEFLGIKNKA